MSVTWTGFKDLIFDKLESDGDSFADMTDISFGTRFDKRAIRKFHEWCRFSHYFYNLAYTVTGVVAGAYTLSTDTNAASQPVHSPVRVWFDGSRLDEVTMPRLEGFTNVSLRSAGAPSCWAHQRQSRIALDRPLDSASAAKTFLVSGWAGHLPITADGTTVDVDEQDLDTLAEYVAAMFMKPAVADEVGLSRLKLYGLASVDRLMEIRARQISVHMGALVKGGSSADAYIV